MVGQSFGSCWRCHSYWRRPGLQRVEAESEWQTRRARRSLPTRTSSHSSSLRYRTNSGDPALHPLPAPLGSDPSVSFAKLTVRFTYCVIKHSIYSRRKIINESYTRNIHYRKCRRHVGRDEIGGCTDYRTSTKKR
jgi:hypothetical protein